MINDALLAFLIYGTVTQEISHMDTIENEIQSKGLTAPRVTPAQIEAVIAEEHYFTAAEGEFGARVRAALKAGEGPQGVELAVHSKLTLLTICVLVLTNGFTVTGESACASPENFDAELGRKIARANAVNKIWPLEGYLLKQRLHDTAADNAAALDSAIGRQA